MDRALRAEVSRILGHVRTAQRMGARSTEDVLEKARVLHRMDVAQRPRWVQRLALGAAARSHRASYEPHTDPVAAMAFADADVLEAAGHVDPHVDLLVRRTRIALETRAIARTFAAAVRFLRRAVGDHRPACWWWDCALETEPADPALQSLPPVVASALLREHVLWRLRGAPRLSPMQRATLPPDPPPRAFASDVFVLDTKEPAREEPCAASARRDARAGESTI